MIVFRVGDFDLAEAEYEVASSARNALYAMFSVMSIMDELFYCGFYLFTFWSSKQTEAINLPDNRCLTIGLRVQRYDYFFSFDNKLFTIFLTEVVIILYSVY